MNKRFVKKKKVKESMNIVELYDENKNCPCKKYTINTCPVTNYPC